MKKIKAFFYVLSKSVTSPKYYNDLLGTNLAFSIKYFLVLALFASMFTTAVTFVPQMSKIKEGVDSFIAHTLEVFPDDFVITTKSGELSINKPEPYIIPMPQISKEERETDQEIPAQKIPANVVVFDANGTIENLESYDTFLLVNKSNILAMGTNKIEVYPLKNLPDGELTKKDLVEFTDSIKPIASAIPYIVLALATISAVFYYFGFRLFYLLFVGLILFVVGRLRGLNLGFGRYYQIGLHALTLPLLVEIAVDTLEISFTLPLWFLTINLIIGVAAVFALTPKTSISQVPPSPEQTQNPD